MAQFKSAEATAEAAYADILTAGVALAQLFFITSLVDVAFGLHWLGRSSLLVGPDTALVEGWEPGKQDL